MKKAIVLISCIMLVFIAKAQYKYDSSVVQFVKNCQTYSNDIMELKDKQTLMQLFDTISNTKTFYKHLLGNVEYIVTVYLKDENEKVAIKIYKEEKGKWVLKKVNDNNHLPFQTVVGYTTKEAGNYKYQIVRTQKTKGQKFNYYFLDFFANYED